MTDKTEPRLHHKTVKIVKDQFEKNEKWYIKLLDVMDKILESFKAESEKGTIHLVKARPGKIKKLTRILQKIEEKKESGELADIKDERLLDEIDDIVGFRIICFFKENLKDIHNWITQGGEFDIDNTPEAYVLEESDIFNFVLTNENRFEFETRQEDNGKERRYVVDKQDGKEIFLVKTKESKYTSLHYIVSLKDKHLETYPELKDFRAEIQVRTLLQDAWAEMEWVSKYRGDEPTESGLHFKTLSYYINTSDNYAQLIRRQTKEEHKLIFKKLHKIIKAEYDEDYPYSWGKMNSILEAKDDSNITIDEFKSIISNTGLITKIKQFYQELLDQTPDIPEIIRCGSYFRTYVKDQAEAFSKRYIVESTMKNLSGLDEEIRQNFFTNISGRKSYTELKPFMVACKNNIGEIIKVRYLGVLIDTLGSIWENALEWGYAGEILEIIVEIIFQTWDFVLNKDEWTCKFQYCFEKTDIANKKFRLRGGSNIRKRIISGICEHPEKFDKEFILKIVHEGTDDLAHVVNHLTRRIRSNYDGLEKKVGQTSMKNMMKRLPHVD